MEQKKFKVLAVGTSDPGKLPIWVGYLKTFIESKSAVKDTACMSIISPKLLKSFNGTLPAIKAENPDMITFTPHEDWNTDELIALCKEVKAWKNIPVVICAENPRNRLQRDAAEKSKAVDYIIHGEAEYPLEALIVAYAENREEIPEFSNMLCLTGSKKTAVPAL
jgi:hypothetical protein